MDAAALSLAVLGFTFGVIALGQVNELKKVVERLRNQLEGD